jgi:hypothetical protein
MEDFTLLDHHVDKITTSRASAGLQWAVAFKRIDETDLLPIAATLQRAAPDGKGWTSSKATLAIREYRRFLKLNAKYPGERIVPSQLVDEVWHTHILDTRKYAADCERIFGRFFHHFPYFGVLGDSDVRDAAFTKTSHFYMKEFGRSSYSLSFGDADRACCDAGDIEAACCDAGDIKAACCDAGDIKAACCDAGDIKAAGCDAGDIKAACCDAGDVVPLSLST